MLEGFKQPFCTTGSTVREPNEGTKVPQIDIMVTLLKDFHISAYIICGPICSFSSLESNYYIDNSTSDTVLVFVFKGALVEFATEFDHKYETIIPRTKDVQIPSPIIYTRDFRHEVPQPFGTVDEHNVILSDIHFPSQIKNDLYNFIKLKLSPNHTQDSRSSGWFHNCTYIPFVMEAQRLKIIPLTSSVIVGVCAGFMVIAMCLWKKYKRNNNLVIPIN